MSMLDKLKSMIKGHPDQSRQGVDKAGDYFDERTGGKYSSQTDKAQGKIDDQLGNDGRSR
jgi:hypothetical protein